MCLFDKWGMIGECSLCYCVGCVLLVFRFFVLYRLVVCNFWDLNLMMFGFLVDIYDDIEKFCCVIGIFKDIFVD